MFGLHELQKAFGASLLSDHEPEIATVVRADGLSGQRRIQIYRNNLFTTLTDALRAVYPVIEKLVSKGFFEYAAHEFISRYPPRHGNLHLFGRDFALFLAEFAPARGHPYLADVARLEWARHEVYHAADAPLLDTRRLAAVPAGRYASLRFQLNPARRLLSSSYPIVRIWQVNQEEYDGDQTADLTAPGECVLILRDHSGVENDILLRSEYVFLAELKKDNTLGESVEASLQLDQDFDLDFFLTKHVQNKTLVDFNAD